jgi:hypothetical protein
MTATSGPWRIRGENGAAVANVQVSGVWVSFCKIAGESLRWFESNTCHQYDQAPDLREPRLGAL